MRVVAFDTETSLIRPGQTAPRLTCLTWTARQEGLRSERDEDWSPAKLANHIDAVALVGTWLADPHTLIVGHNVAFDLAVMCVEAPRLVPLVFQAYEEQRVTDTMLRQKLIDIAEGRYRGYFDPHANEGKGKGIKYGYTLQELARRLAGVPIKKEGYRMFYGPFRGVPLASWTEHARKLAARGAAWLDGERDTDIEHLAACFGDREKFRKEVEGMIAADPSEVVTYPLEDATATAAVFDAQAHAPKAYLIDQYRQACKAWCLHLASAWGMRTDRINVARLQRATINECERLQGELVAAGLVRPNGTRDTEKAKERMLAACGWAWDPAFGDYVGTRPSPLPLRRTDKGEVSLDSDACKASDDPLLEAYAELTSLKTVLNKDIPALARASTYPIHTRFDLAETGRVTSSSPNIQNWRRLPGIREAFTPRPGHVYIQADYSGLELATLAQACIDLLGHSELAKVLNTGKDPHTDLGALILGIPYAEAEARRKSKDQEFDDARQTAKVANFGFPGGLGAVKLCLFARKTYGVELSEARAKELKQVWLAKWPEMAEYFAHVNELSKRAGDEGITIKQLRSDRIRGGASYTAACNSYFQGLGADATAAAFWLVQKACYLETTSPLFGCRVVNYIHDELIAEAPLARAPEAAEELSRLMVEGVKAWIPNIKMAAEPCVMAVWSKEAKTLRDASGRLQVWSPATSKKVESKESKEGIAA